MEQYRLSSGYAITVKTLGPFTLDPLRARWKDPGPFTYKVETKGEGVVDFLYDPPKTPPPPPLEGNQEEWALYQAYLAHERKRKVILEGFERDSTALVMLNCFEIVDGPGSVEDDEWLERLGPFLDAPPKSKAERLLLFYKTQVFAIPFEEWAAIRQVCVAPEVDLESIFNALEMFRSNLGWGGAEGDLGSTAGGETEPQHAGVGSPGGGVDAS